MEEQNTKSSYDLSRQASEFLKRHGFDIFGRTRREVNFLQINFEKRMQTGAYSRSSESKRR